MPTTIKENSGTSGNKTLELCPKASSPFLPLPSLYFSQVILAVHGIFFLYDFSVALSPVALITIVCVCDECLNPAF